jgi:hypothetical protein
VAVTLEAPVSVAQLEEMLGREAQTTVEQGRDAMLAILDRLDVPVYRPQDVDAYRAKMVKRATRVTNWFEHLLIPANVVAVVVLIFDIFAMYTYVTFDARVPAILGRVGFGLIVFLLASFIIAEKVHAKRATWLRFALGRYTSEIPEDAVKLVRRLQADDPSLVFSIDEFRVNLEKLDPLLYVSLGSGMRYCIAAWDEPRFEAKLMH